MFYNKFKINKYLKQWNTFHFLEFTAEKNRCLGHLTAASFQRLCSSSSNQVARNYHVITNPRSRASDFH